MAIPKHLNEKTRKSLYEYRYWIATNPVELNDLSYPSEIRGKTVILQGAGPSGTDLEDLPHDDPDTVTVTIQRAIVHFQQHASIWDVAFLNDPLSKDYLPGIPEGCKLLVSWHFLTRKPQHKNPELLDPYRDRVYTFPMTLQQVMIGTGPTAVLWALQRQETERIILCGFNPRTDHEQSKKRYKYQLPGWKAIGQNLVDLHTPIYVSQNTDIPGIDWPVWE